MWVRRRNFALFGLIYFLSSCIEVRYRQPIEHKEVKIQTEDQLVFAQSTVNGTYKLQVQFSPTDRSKNARFIASRPRLYGCEGCLSFPLQATMTVISPLSPKNVVRRTLARILRGPLDELFIEFADSIGLSLYQLMRLEDGSYVLVDRLSFVAGTRGLFAPDSPLASVVQVERFSRRPVFSSIRSSDLGHSTEVYTLDNRDLSNWILPSSKLLDPLWVLETPVIQLSKEVQDLFENFFGCELILGTKISQ